MEAKVCEAPGGGMYVERGPILYSFPIPADIQEDTEIYDNLAGKASANPDFKSWSMTPAGKWNYAIDVAALDRLRVNQHSTEGFPFDLGQSPVSIDIPAVGVVGWDLEEGRYTPALPADVTAEQEQPTLIRLVPYGSTTLRLTTFPVYRR